MTSIFNKGIWFYNGLHHNKHLFKERNKQEYSLPMDSAFPLEMRSPRQWRVFQRHSDMKVKLKADIKIPGGQIFVKKKIWQVGQAAYSRLQSR
jgi:hypothetical protein